MVLPLILITNAGLIMVDHIHFQYNGIMFGVLLLSIAYMLKVFYIFFLPKLAIHHFFLFKENYLVSAFWFCVLLNMKHIYVYLAPAYFIYLLRNFCIVSTNLTVKNILQVVAFKKLLILGSLVLSVFFVTYIPFYDHIGQVRICLLLQPIFLHVNDFRCFQECFRLKEACVMRIGRRIFGLFTISSTKLYFSFVRKTEKRLLIFYLI